jgi:hypothetical protein
MFEDKKEYNHAKIRKNRLTDSEDNNGFNFSALIKWHKYLIWNIYCGQFLN